jgi:malate dehydrogenase (oxaloacetate-decarboxylating)
MFLVAAEALAKEVGEDRLEIGALYPNQSELRKVSRAVAVAVARCARDGGVGRHFMDEEIEPAVDAMIWQPDYVPYEPAEIEIAR